jgi:beta-glucosidase
MNRKSSVPIFQFAVATSSYQIEGNVDRDGRSDGIWDVFARRNGAIRNGDDATMACDHYLLWQEDLALLRELGVDGYRFSLSWPRLLPDGIGQVNEAGVAHYEALLDKLCEAGIAPWLTLYHWDLPQALQDRGGWQNREIVHWLDEFADLVDRRFGKYLDKLIVLNEACMTSHRGHAFGTDAPGVADRAAFFAAIHHQNLAQGRVLRSLAGRSYEIGTAVLIQPAVAATDSEADRSAAAFLDATWNGACLDPLFRGSYPADLADDLGPLIRDGDMELVRQPIDFLGVNYYVRSFVRSAPGTVLGLERARGLGEDWRSPFGMECYPKGLEDVLAEVRESCGNPTVLITECGYADTDDMSLDSLIEDDERIRYLEALLQSIDRANAAGSDVRGMAVWSLLDNFEWEFGYWPRFGLVHVDYQTLRRTPKKSFHWLGERIAAGRAGDQIDPRIPEAGRTQSGLFDR